MKIVVLDGYTENPGDLSWAPLEALGEVTVYDRTSYEESPLIAERIGDAEIVVMNKTPISKTTLEKCPNVKMIAVLATGFNVVDLAAAKERGIPVCNVPNYGGYSVSQFTIALMLEACLHIGHHDRTVHEGKWQNSPDWCYWDYPLIELAGKTFGLLGCGRIGIHTAEAAKGLGMHVIAYNRSQSQAAKDLGVEFVESGRPVCPVRRAGPPDALSGLQRGHHQQGEHRQDEGRRDHPQQQPGANGGRAGSGGRSEQRQGGLRRAGRGLHRAHPGRQSPADGEKLHHHPAHVLGLSGQPPADHGLHGEQYQGVSERNTGKCGKSVSFSGRMPIYERGI